MSFISWTETTPWNVNVVGNCDSYANFNVSWEKYDFNNQTFKFLKTHMHANKSALPWHIKCAKTL